MKRLITLSGPGGRAILELGERPVVKGAKGTLYLADSAGNVFPEGEARGDIIGAFLLDESRLVMQGCFAGHSRAMAVARERLLMSVGEKQPRPRPQTPLEKQPAPSAPPPPPKSDALLQILQKAAELFPPEQAAPRPQPSPDNNAIVNPFPKAFPFSRWRRVEYPGTDSCYLEGEARCRGADYVIHALPGDRRPPPQGYTRFLRARDGSGFWVRIRRK